ncbi:hypothetical protein J7J18_00360 [bacterium]|nr:hypothetical protein [bacterium]
MKNKAILILVLIVGFLLGIMVGYSSKRVDTKFIYQQGYEKGWQEAKNLIEEKVPFLQTPKEVFNIEGEVLEVSTDWLKIKAKPISINPLSELYKETIRKVKITPTTKIIKEERILPSSLPKSLEELEEILQKERQGKKITLSEIKKGDRVRVTSKENILTEKEFQADKIVLMK